MNRHQGKDRELLSALVPGKPTPARAWTPLLIIALSIAAAVIAVVVYLTPKPVDDPELIAQLKKELNLQLPESAPQPPSFPPASLVLPTQPQSITDEKLFESLTKLADSLLSDLPNDPASLHNAALIFSELKQTSKAESLWKSCLAKRPTQPGPYIGLADLLMKLGRTDEAADLLEKNWSQLAAWPSAAQIRAKVLDQLGEPEQAVKLLESSLRSNPEVVDNWLELGQLQNQLQLYTDAEKSLRTAVALGMTANETLIFALSTAVGRQNRADEAKKLLEKFQELKKTGADPSGNRFQDAYSSALRKIATRAYVNAASLYSELNKPQQAEQTVMQLLALDPDHVTGLMTLSTILRRGGRLPDALMVQQRILQLEPDNPLNVINLASVMIDMGELAQAEEILKRAAEQARPDSGLLQAELAQIYMALRRYDEARSYARQAAQRQPTREHFTLLATACKALDDKGGLFEAISTIEQMDRARMAQIPPAQATSGVAAERQP